MVIPSSAPFGEARGEGQWCLPGLICQMLEGPVPKCGVRKAGADARPGLGATQGEVNGGTAMASPAALSPLKPWLFPKTLIALQNSLPAA